MIYVGIDMQPANMTLTALNDNDDLVCENKITCSCEELSTFFDLLERPIQAVVESTSNWHWLNDWCLEINITLTLVHAKNGQDYYLNLVFTDSGFVSVGKIINHI